MKIPGIYKSFLERWKDYQTIWIYSDPHFGDRELAKGIANRPSDEEQIKFINSKVGKKDILIILGDCGDPLCCAQLRGYKVLVMGNHDSCKSKYEEAFDEIYEGPIFLGEKLLLSHEPIELPFAFNIHGHDHSGTARRNHLNVCSDVIGYMPINLNQLMKHGLTKNVQSIHRITIDTATKRKGRK